MANGQKPIHFRLTMLRQGRHTSDANWQEIEPAYLEAWKKISEMDEFHSLLSKGQNFEIGINYRDVIKDIEEQIQLHREFEKNKDYDIYRDYRHVSQDLKISLDYSESAYSSHVEYFLYKLFILLSISAPGCIQFRDSTLHRVPPQYSMIGTEIFSDISLSGEHFEEVLYVGEKYSWLKAQFLDPATVLPWLNLALPDCTMVPETPAGKALLALIRITQLGYGPEATIWIFYALETMLGRRLINSKPQSH